MRAKKRVYSLLHRVFLRFSVVSISFIGLYIHTYIHTFIDHFPKGAFQCQLQRKG